MQFYKWEADAFMAHWDEAKSHRIIKKDINEDNHDFILWELVAETDRRHLYIYSLHKKEIVVAVKIDTNDKLEDAVLKLQKIYETIEF